MKKIDLIEVDSTNEYCKREDRGEDLIVTAKRQTAGKGTKGRSFLSPDGGLYLSVLRHYEGYPASQTFHIMVDSCVAVCKTVEKFGVTPVIRWSNDVLVDGLKISGTLIENSFCGDRIVRSIVGIGINVNNILPPELKGIATSLRIVTGKMLDYEEFRRELTDHLTKKYTLEDYKYFMPWLGSQVVLQMNEERKTVKAIDVAEDGRLVVQREGKEVVVSAAEVSLRF